VVILRPILAMSRKGLEIIILDRGKSIDPTAICGRDLSDIRPGGLGVHIIRSVMDKVQYRQRLGGGMLLRMVKYGSAAPAGTPPGKGSPGLEARAF
jgi:serine/threonine-protein kinase RsbW